MSMSILNMLKTLKKQCEGEVCSECEYHGCCLLEEFKIMDFNEISSPSIRNKIKKAYIKFEQLGLVPNHHYKILSE